MADRFCRNRRCRVELEADEFIVCVSCRAAFGYGAVAAAIVGFLWGWVTR